MRAWLRSWWVTLRRGSILTRSGRELRRNLRDDASAYVEVQRPGFGWARMHHGICPKCREGKFIGHGPLCTDCYLTSEPTP